METVVPRIATYSVWLNISEGGVGDVVINTEDEKVLQKKNRYLEHNAVRKRNEIEYNKTKRMIIEDEMEKMKLHIEDVKIKQVKAFRYMGVEIEEGGKHEAEINKGIEEFIHHKQKNY